jgi:pyridoxal phosphate enzyme (YggS family)
MNEVAENISTVREKIAAAALRASRDPSRVRLMGVTKTVDDERILESIRAGIDIVGENYVQEAKRKIEKMGRSVPWHLIGHLQTNKAKYAVKLFDMVHSVDRISLAQELNRRAGLINASIDILIEVNVSGEGSKSGVDPEQAIGLVREVAQLPNLGIKGLMTMAPWFDDQEEARPYFRRLRELKDAIAAADIPGVEMKELSMGMSGDYEVAVEEGATIVRIGTKIFGARHYD